ncbi:APC membrane recruitment protein 2 [Leucoraja erinacea]|uniref:APC membrane recruitment protein 2 n=1 Tax=Leucoraja erinaceus TaxID=7782 RepID=UPI00245482A9|nr:APC membrane recruitment protein 2 [Leucoraja erinacea]
MELNSSSTEAASGENEHQAAATVYRKKKDKNKIVAVMDLHCECNEISASEQQSGKISRTAFKLFGRRKSGGTMPNIFSLKNKGDGKSSVKMGLVRSKTHDGIADMGLEVNKKEDSLSNYQLDSDSSTKIVSSMSFAAAGCGPIAKSHSFFSLLRRNSKLENCKGESVCSNSDQMKERSCSRQKKGLKGLFSSMRWHRKDKISREEKAGQQDIADFLTLPGSLTASLECVKEESQKSIPESESTGMDVKLPCEIQSDNESVFTEDVEQADSRTSLPELHQYVENVTIDSHSMDHPSNDKVLDQLEDKRDENTLGARQDVQEEGASETGSASCHLAESGSAGPTNNDPPAEQSIDRICIMFSDVTSLKSFDSLTGCGDVIVDQEEDGNACESGAAAEKGKGGGRKSAIVLSYQGGGEEMASPDEVDDEYLQEFWDPPPPVTEAGPVASDQTQLFASGTATCLNEAGDSTLLKQLHLNDISISKNDDENPISAKCDQPESVPNSDEGYWDSTTPGHEDESGKTLATRASIPRDSYSGDGLHDLLTDPEESLTSIVSDEEICSVAEPKTLSPKAVSSITTISKDRNISAIPRHKTTITARQGDVNHIHWPQTVQQLLGCEPVRTKIPIAKTSIPRPNHKVITGSTAKVSTNKGGTKK